MTLSGKNDQKGFFFFFLTQFFPKDGNGSKWISSDQATSAKSGEWRHFGIRYNHFWEKEIKKHVKKNSSILHTADQNVVESIKETVKGIYLEKERQK